MDLIALYSSVAKPVPLRRITHELERRRDTILASLDGPALELFGPAADSEASSANTVVSIGWLGAQSDPGEALASLVELIGGSGELHFVEPSINFGFRRHYAICLAKFAVQRSGWWPNHDMTALMRKAGLVVTNLERFFIPEVPLLYSSWVQGRAILAPAKVEIAVSRGTPSEG